MCFWPKGTFFAKVKIWLSRWSGHLLSARSEGLGFYKWPNPRTRQLLGLSCRRAEWRYLLRGLFKVIAMSAISCSSCSVLLLDLPLFGQGCPSRPERFSSQMRLNTYKMFSANKQPDPPGIVNEMFLENDHFPCPRYLPLIIWIQTHQGHYNRILTPSWERVRYQT